MLYIQGDSQAVFDELDRRVQIAIGWPPPTMIWQEDKCIEILDTPLLGSARWANTVKNPKTGKLAYPLDEKIAEHVDLFMKEKQFQALALPTELATEWFPPEVKGDAA